MLGSIEDSRAAVLARMVSKAPEQKLGRTQLMKLLYFLQELKGESLGYDFRLFNYGPFDSEVLSDLSSACGLGVVIEKTVLHAKGYGYEITPTANANKLSDELEAKNASLAATVDQIVSEFGKFSAAELELRSTIAFVDREFHQDGTSSSTQELAIRVRQIKPHFSNETILDRINNMKESGWLISLPDREVT